MSNHDWYELTEGPALTQGDLLRECPVFAVADSLSWLSAISPIQSGLLVVLIGQLFCPQSIFDLSATQQTPLRTPYPKDTD